MEYVSNYKPAKIATFGRKVFEISEQDDKKAAILATNSLRMWLKSLNAAKHYSDINVIIEEKDMLEMIEKAKVSYPLGNYYKLDSAAIRTIFEMGN